MNPTLSSQQISFFANNGYLELEELFSGVECVKFIAAIQSTLTARGRANPLVSGRDLWRDSPQLKTLVFSKKLSSLAAALAGKQPLRIGCDQFFPSTYSLSKPEKVKDLFSIQGLSCAIFIRFESKAIEGPQKSSPIGISPFPKASGSALIIQSNLLLNWPPMIAGTDLYMVAYAEANGVYIHNPNDPANLTLRRLGYGYGDPLNSEHHPHLRT